MADRFVKPLTRVGVLENFWEKASDKLWAGSVLINKTDFRWRDNWIANEHEFVVLPTPPFPPTKIHFKLFWFIIDSSVGALYSSDMEKGFYFMTKRWVKFRVFRATQVSKTARMSTTFLSVQEDAHRRPDSCPEYRKDSFIHWCCIYNSNGIKALWKSYYVIY